jgi:hypothetical protein
MDRCASRLRTLVESLILASLGDRPKVEKTVDVFRGQPGADDIVSLTEKRLAAGTDDVVYFAGGFRGGIRARRSIR